VTPDLVFSGRQAQRVSTRSADSSRACQLFDKRRHVVVFPQRAEAYSTDCSLLVTFGGESANVALQ